MSQFFTSGGQSTGVSASASVLSMNQATWEDKQLSNAILSHHGDDLGDITEFMNKSFQGRPAANKSTVE